MRQKQFMGQWRSAAARLFDKLDTMDLENDTRVEISLRRRWNPDVKGHVHATAKLTRVQRVDVSTNDDEPAAYA